MLKMWIVQWEQTFKASLQRAFFIQEKNDSFSVPGMPAGMATPVGGL